MGLKYANKDAYTSEFFFLFYTFMYTATGWLKTLKNNM